LAICHIWRCNAARCWELVKVLFLFQFAVCYFFKALTGGRYPGTSLAFSTPYKGQRVAEPQAVLFFFEAVIGRGVNAPAQQHVACNRCANPHPRIDPSVIP
jgi:hypothetical protein